MAKMYLGEIPISKIYGSGTIETTDKNAPEYISKYGVAYRKILEDHFDGGDIDHNIWREDYMPSRVETAYNAYSDVRCEDSLLKIRVKKDMGGRDGTENGLSMAVSTVQSAVWNGMHLPDPTYHYFRPWYGFMSQEGYYEVRAKLVSGSGVHTAWWMIGTENTELEVCEFDIFEVLGLNPSVIPFYLHTNGDTSLSAVKNTYDTEVDLSLDFHTYGFLWEDGRLRLYLDGNLIMDKTCNTPKYPMITFLTLYKRKYGSGLSGDADTTLGDLEMHVDYIKVYKKADTVETSPVSVSSYEPINISITKGTYTVDEYSGFLTDMPLYCFVTWSDGSRTEHWVKWDRFDDAKKTILDSGGTLEWEGIAYGIGIPIKATITVS